MAKLNLCKILKGHEGGVFHSHSYGKVVLQRIYKHRLILLKPKSSKIIKGIEFSVSSNGRIHCGGEIDLFPSKGQRDWNKWIEEQKSKVPKTWSELKTTEGLCPKILECKSDICGTYDGTEKNTSIEKSALALLKIHQLIEAIYGGNVTNEEWVNSDGNNLIYVPFYNPIEKEFQSFGIFGLHRKSLIAFHTHKQIKEFLKYPENVKLFKDYFMI